MNETVFKRHPNNPIITAKAVPTANSIHNSAVVKVGDNDYQGVFRIDHQDLKFRLHHGTSPDGLDWKINPEPIKFESNDPDVLLRDLTYDPRLVKIDDTYYVTWCNSGDQGPCIGLGYTKDFKTWTQMEDPLPTANRNSVLFPRKINGQYAMYHRPSDRGHTPFGDIFYASSPDLVHWGRHRWAFGTKGGWQSTKLGPGPNPIETKEGWLLIYHGVWTSCNGYLYYAGGALMDLDKPWKVIARTKSYLLAPTEIYERVGDVPNVVFPSSAVVEGDNLRLYYGCADTCVSVADAKIPDIIDFIKKNSF